MKEKKIPLRKCVITNEQYPKNELLRVVRTPEGEVVIDTTGKVRGHGAYVCKDKKVIALAQKKKTLDRALETTVPQDIYDELLKLVWGEING